MSILDDLLATRGLTRQDFPPLKREASSQGVARSRCLERVAGLSRRDPDAEALALVGPLSAALRREESTAVLRPVQALALAELYEREGLLAGIEVGAGKTLISYLAPSVVYARRPVLLIPARLREKTRRDFDALALEWISPSVIYTILSYEEMSREDRATLIDDLAPDLIVADEAHHLKNPRAAVTRRVGRYLRRGACRFVGMSGTLTTRSLRDFAHLAAWALGQDAPVPLHEPTLREWCAALDPGVDDGWRISPGMLLEALPPAADDEVPDDLERARAGLRRRIRETSACVITRRSECPASIYVEEVALEPHPPEVEAALCRLRHDWETPGGEPLEEAARVWAVAQQVVLGFYYELDPPAPRDWREARRTWSSACREVLEGNRRDLDTARQVATAVDRGLYPGAEDALAAWRAVRDTFTPRRVARWLSHAPLARVACLDAGGPAIWWTSHVEFGRALATCMDAPYAGEQGRLADGRLIDDLAGGCSVVASVQSCGTGRNLQAWSRSVITCPPADAGTWEQLLGRTHRQGQLADVVEVVIAVGCAESRAAVDKAFGEARYVEQTTGAPQRLLRADWPARGGQQAKPDGERT
mgnify:CR=1 FL=1